MKNVNIIRVEHILGDGIFSARNNNGTYILDEYWDSTNFYKKHNKEFPTPEMDGLDIQDNEYCAFNNFELFKSFFKYDDITFLIKNNFVFYIINVNVHHYKIGEYQTLYEKNDIINKIEFNPFLYIKKENMLINFIKRILNI